MNEEEWLHTYTREKPDEKLRREYVKQVCDAIYIGALVHNDFSAIAELLAELRKDPDTYLSVWNGLNSRERRFIKTWEQE